MREYSRVLGGAERCYPNGSRESGGKTPLLWAAAYGHERVVNLQFNLKDVSPNRPGKSGQAPLSLATSPGTIES